MSSVIMFESVIMQLFIFGLVYSVLKLVGVWEIQRNMC